MLKQILTIAAGVSSILGFLSVALTLYFWFTLKKTHERLKRSIREVVEGDRFFNAEQVIIVLEKFADDTNRLNALKVLSRQEAKRADELLKKLKGNVNLEAFDESQRKSQLRTLVLISGIFIVIALIAFGARAFIRDDDGNGNTAKVCKEIEERLPVLKRVEDKVGVRNDCTIKPLSDEVSYRDLMIAANTCDSGCLSAAWNRAKISILSSQPDTSQPDITLTYVLASAGIGKSTFFQEGLGTPQPSNCEKTCTYRVEDRLDLRIESLKKWFEDSPEHPNLILMPSGRAINELPGDEVSASKIMSTIFDDYNRVKKTTILLLDDLDELHPRAAKAVLSEVDQYVSRLNDADTAHVFVVGRAEGFIGHERRAGSKAYFQRISFSPPAFVSSDQIKARYDNYVEWRIRVRGESSPPFEVVQNALSKHTFLCESYSLQMLSGPIINNAASWAGSLNEDQIKDELLNEMFTRNSKSHKRPPTGDRGYRQSLVTAILRQLSPRPDDGDFFVPYDAQVPYDQTNSVNVNDLLDRSGLVRRDPIDINRYKFVPAWIPSHLLQSYQKELGCPK